MIFIEGSLVKHTHPSSGEETYHLLTKEQADCPVIDRKYNGLGWLDYCTIFNIGIGTIFMVDGKPWKITDQGIDGWWGATSQKTNAFSSFSVDDIINRLINK